MVSDASSTRGTLSKIIRRRRLTTAILLACAAGLALVSWLALRRGGGGPDSGDRLGSAFATAPGETADEWIRKPEFIGSQACRNCHPDQFESFLETSHSRALARALPDAEPRDAVFDDPVTSHRYRVSRQDGQLFHEAALLLADGTIWESTRFPVRYRLGSGHLGRTYLAEDNGFFLQSPITWYANRNEWRLSLGYDVAGLKSFERVVSGNCLFCHAGSLETSAASDLRVRLVEHSIGCERCHGPGRAHVDRELKADVAATPTDSLIVNPRRLSRRQSDAVCNQCHLQGDIQVRARGARSEDYQSGLSLEAYRHDYVVRRPGAKVQSVRHSEQLELSACYRGSAKLQCVTCHDPHATVAPEDRAEHYRSACLSCHESQSCRLPLRERVDTSQDRCADCHMPRAATEVAHLAFTHHQIGIHPLPETTSPEGDDQLVPLFDLEELSAGDRQRSLGLAWQQRSMHPGEDARAVLLRQNAAARAEEMLTTLPEECIDGAVEMALAGVYFSRNQFPRAEASVRRALAHSDLTSDEKTRALAMLAGMDYERQRYAEAATSLAELTRLRRYAGDWYYLGICESHCDDIAGGIRALERARAIDPEHVETYEQLARMHHARKDRAAESRMQNAINRLTNGANRSR